MHDCYLITTSAPKLGSVDDTFFVHYGTYIRPFDRVSLVLPAIQLVRHLTVGQEIPPFTGNGSRNYAAGNG